MSVSCCKEQLHPTSPQHCVSCLTQESDLSLEWSQVPRYLATSYSDSLREWSSWVHGHSTKHATWHIQAAQCAFKVLMIPKSCNSHYVSHFAAFFIVTGTKISVAKSCFSFVFLTLESSQD